MATNEQDENKAAAPLDPDATIADVQNLPDEMPPEESFAADQSLDSMLRDEANKKPEKPPQQNMRQILYGAGGVALLILILAIYSCQPKDGSMAFGICSTFLELQTPYPHTLRYTDIEGSQTAVRIYFTNVDPFGEFKQEMIECTFGPDDVMGMKLTQVTRNRRPVDSTIVKKFNITLPTIMASDPYLVLPPDWKNPLVPE